MSLARQLNCIQRLLGTALGYVTFGLGGMIFALVVVPWIWTQYREPTSRSLVLRRAISRSFRLHVNLLRTLGVLDYRVQYRERLYPGQLIIANHPTLLDVVFLVGFIDNAVCVVKDGLLHNFWIGFVIRAANYVSSKEPERMIEACADALQRGESIIIFPEGTRTVPGERSQLQRGAAYIALQAHVRLRPVRISCVPGSMAKMQAWYDIPESKMQFTFVVDQEIDASDYYDKQRTLGARGVNQEIERVLLNISSSTARRATVESTWPHKTGEEMQR